MTPSLSHAGTINKGDTSQLVLSSFDENSRNSSLLGPQPEDVDDELDMTFRSRGCPLADLYPSMVDRVKQACRRQHTTEAADLVLRRYRRWRQQPSRSSSFSNSLSAAPRHVPHKQTAQRERSDRSLKICDAAQSPLKVATNGQAWSALERSPGRVRRPQSKPILVIDLSHDSETSNPTEVSLNETFNVPEPKPPSTFDFSPSRSTGSLEPTLRSKRLSLPGRSLQANGNCVHVTDRPGDSQSPVRQSTLRSKMQMILSRSPRASLRSPGARSMEGFSREPKRHRSLSESLTSAANMPLRGFCPQTPHVPFTSQPSPKRSASTSGPRRFRRHLSLDSSLWANGSSWSPERLDDEFIKLYHRFVCQNRASFHHGPPCRFCARSFEVNRGHSSCSSSSSSALAALALSPHRSLLRKRHREVSWESHPQSKRLRDECYVSSPGSKRHVKEMLRRRLSPFEPETSRDRISISPRSGNLLSKFNNQLHKPQDVWMSLSSR